VLNLTAPLGSVGACARVHALTVARDAGCVGDAHTVFIFVMMAHTDAHTIKRGFAAAKSVTI